MVSGSALLCKWDVAVRRVADALRTHAAHGAPHGSRTNNSHNHERVGNRLVTQHDVQRGPGRSPRLSHHVHTFPCMPTIFLSLCFYSSFSSTVKNIVPLYQKYCENNLQNSIVVGWLQYFGYNAHCTKGEGGGEGTISAYTAIVKIIYNT